MKKHPSLIERVVAILLLGGLYVFMAWTCANGAEIQSPISEVKDTIQKLKNIVNDPSLKGDAKKPVREGKIRELILERLDLGDMCKRALGRHWKQKTDTERAEYIKACSRYVEVLHRKMVFESVQFVESVAVRFLKERIDGEFAEVDLAIESSPEDIKVTFKLHLADGHWKAYDIVIEGISMVQNLREQFDTVIRKKSFEKLLEELLSKN